MCLSFMNGARTVQEKQAGHWGFGLKNTNKTLARANEKNVDWPNMHVKRDIILVGEQLRFNILSWRKYKESAHMLCTANLVSQSCLEFSLCFTLIIKRSV
jgi:hypothetical protein